MFLPIVRKPVRKVVSQIVKLSKRTHNNAVVTENLYLMDRSGNHVVDRSGNKIKTREA